MSPNPYEQYQTNKVMTASPAELTLMLYDGAIKFGNIAIQAMEKKDIEKAQELKQFSEIGVQRFFIHSREVQEEEEAEIRKLLEEQELLEKDSYIWR